MNYQILDRRRQQVSRSREQNLVDALEKIICVVDSTEDSGFKSEELDAIRFIAWTNLTDKERKESSRKCQKLLTEEIESGN